MKNNNIGSSKTANEILYAPVNGWAALIISIVVYIVDLLAMVFFAVGIESSASCVLGFIITLVYLCVGWIWWLGLKVIRPNEALVLTLFGKYIGTVKSEGFFFVNPFCVAVCPTNPTNPEPATTRVNVSGVSVQANTANINLSRKVSLKVMTHNNGKQKINDILGNPLEVGIIVIWRVCDTARAVFNVDNYHDFLSINADSVLRDVVRQYPYDTTTPGETSLRESSAEISDQLQALLSERVECAGLEIVEARITHLAYAPEIAVAMLQRQQATALIDARQKIVDGAVGMVQMALEKINHENICELDDERKAQMVSNLLVVLCGNRDAQPIVNTGSIY